MFFSRSTWGMEREQTSTLGKCQVPSGISKKYIGMPSATKLFQEYVEKNYLNAGQRAHRRHPKTIWYWDIEVVQNLKECTENLLSSGGAGGLPADAMHPVFGQFVRKNRQNARKAERFAKNKSTYPHSARNIRKPLLGRGRLRRSGRSGQRGFTTPSKAPATPFRKTPK